MQELFWRICITENYRKMKEMDEYFQESEIQRLEGEIFELQFKLKECHDKELTYKQLLSEIRNSIDEIIELEMENERFRLEAEIDYKSCITNLKNYLQEYKRVYKLRF